MSRQCLPNLPSLTNPTAGETKFLVLDSTVEQTLTVARAQALLATPGPAGPTGPQGFQGFAGSKGYTGSSGFAGSVGYTGSIGFTGSRGFTGSLGYSGSVGAQGPQGFTGSRGFSGSQGYTGSASNVIGYTGSLGQIGPQGPAGFTGSAAPCAATSNNISGGFAGNIPIQTSPGATAFIPLGANGTLMYSDGTTATWVSTSTLIPASAGQAGKVFVSTITNTSSTIYYPGMFKIPGVYDSPGVNVNLNYVAATGILSTPKVQLTNASLLQDTAGGAVSFGSAISNQGTAAVAIGKCAAASSQGASGIAIGLNAGKTSQGANAIALGANASPNSQRANSIVINATGVAVTATNAGAYIAPVRMDSSNSATTYTINYNTITNEVTYNCTPIAGFTGSGGYFGSTGYTGSRGYDGSRAYTGSAGFTGSSGFAGSKGFTGSGGYTGSLGYTGSAGFTGSAGVGGYFGSQGYAGSLGYTGSQGDIGYFGSAGYTGSFGTTGYVGSIGYAGSIGFTGSRGFTGSQGTTGTVGYTGSIGTGIQLKGTVSSTGTGFTNIYAIVPACTAVQGDAILDSSNEHLWVYNPPNPSNIYGWTDAGNIQGPLGFTGSSGFAGSQGYAGSVGYGGSLGYTGSASTATGYIGSTGPQGPLGFTGSVGPSGPQGYAGSIGATATAPNFKGTKLSSSALPSFGATLGDAWVIYNAGSPGSGQDANGSVWVYTGATGGTSVNGFVYIGQLTGYTGSSGGLGYTGSLGFSGSLGYSGSAGGGGCIGYTGSRGFAGSNGYNGSTGYVGSAGTSLNIKGAVPTNVSLPFVGNTGDIYVTTCTPASTLWTWTGYTGSSGTSAGQQYNGWLNIGSAGTKGFTGSAGFEGSAGYTGSASTAPGYTGSAGFTGSAGGNGTPGCIGFTGSRGGDGSPGVGLLGYTGSAGAGFTGSGGAGYTGSAGAGYTGSAGSVGPTGPLGYAGSSVVGFAGSNGYSGSQGQPGPTGPTGPQGFPGYDGSASTIPGYDGSAGYTGSEGSGYTGSAGEIGYTGSSGQMPECAGTDKINAQVWSNSSIYTQFYPVMVAAAGTSSAYIAQLPNYEFNAAAGTITIGGNINAQGCGTNNFGGGLKITGIITATGAIYTCASIVAKGNITGFGCFSDVRLKENIRPINDALAKLRTLEGVLYDWTDAFLDEMDMTENVSKHDTGLIAQEVQKVLPEVIIERENGYLGIKYEKVVGLIVQAINELADRVDRLTE